MTHLLEDVVSLAVKTIFISAQAGKKYQVLASLRLQLPNLVMESCSSIT